MIELELLTEEELEVELIDENATMTLDVNDVIIIQGYSGSLGYTGSVGYTGSRGETGYAGTIGATGYTGSVGAIGATGYRGQVGYTGSFGYTGSIGLTGYTGSVGATPTLDDATTSAKGIVQLSDATDETSSAKAATPTAVKSAYDLANAALPKSGGTTTGSVIGYTGTDYTTARFRNITLSTSDPSGGNNGDIWIKYTA